jgi:hypothetical protein
MAKLATLQLMQPISARSTTRGPTNKEARAPPPLGFPHTMLIVKKVKHNMRLAFIEKLFTNHEIRTSVQTRYLCFKGMLYKSESYLCDINCRNPILAKCGGEAQHLEKLGVGVLWDS